MVIDSESIYTATKAYIDLGSGSYIIQIALASLFGLLVTTKLFWSGIFYKIKGLVKPNKEKEKAEVD